MVRKRDVLLTCMFVLHVTLGVKPPAARVNPEECRSLMDLYFVIDGSDSIDTENFKLLQDAIASMIPEIDLGPTKARIGMLVYSSHVPGKSEHTFSYDPGYLTNAAMTLAHPRDGTDTQLGIKHMRKIFKTNGRKNVPWVCVVITDGISKNPPETILQAKEAAKMGISMFAVGIGHKIAIQELEEIASTKNQVMAIRDFSELKDMLQSMMFRICPCPVPPVVPLAKCNDGPRAIGSVRTYQCMDGYLRRGDPNIICQGDFTWTPLATDFECVPCDKTTPFVQHGTCGIGEFTIGAKRTFTCNTGYRGIGDPTIECLSDATWSIPTFKCVPCGPTPTVPHGICGSGDFTIGALRRFTCEPGYRLIGKETIECLDHKDWLRPRWSEPEAQCVPCGKTPSVPHGICGSGDFTIGALRRFTCEPGYRLIGKETIECLDHKDWLRPRWSEPEAQCVPCGKTPDIENAICMDGDFLLGSRRTYICAAGYFLAGNPHITCLDDASWSKPKFACKDCSDPPIIPHAYTGTGSSLIGSKRVYYCENGFKMVGRGEAVCGVNGQWKVSHFSCKGIPPKPIQTGPSVCDRCRYLNGVGYANHPFDCNQYVQCYRGKKGLEPTYRKCAFGLFWDQNVLTCRPSHEVDCPHDRCKDLSLRSYKHTDRDNCCAYWKCQNGRSFGECCNDGSSYNSARQQCVKDHECTTTCPYKNEIPACDKRPAARDTMFEQHIINDYWVPMHCAPGTAYNPVDCECSLRIMTIPGKTRQQVCKPELYLPFNNGFNDRSGKNVYVKPENMSIHNGAAYFDGHARILINRFANTEFTGDLVIKFRYNEFKHGDYFNSLQALVTNGDCGSDPSIVIAKMPGYVLLGAKADVPKSFALPTLDKQWKEVIYIHNEKKLEGKVCGASMGKWSYGPIQATHCALQIGYGNGLQSYVGLIDDLYIYRCRPRAQILNIEY